MNINELGGVSQIGMVVRDAHATMRYMIEILGIGPFFVASEVVAEDFRYRGKPSASPVLTLAFAQSGAVQIELIEQHNDVPSAYSEFIGAGREGCQHFSIWFADKVAYTAAREQLLGEGLALVHEVGDTAIQRFAYFESRIPGGLMIELAEALTPEGHGLMDIVKEASIRWDGLDPIRYL
ncbi:MAG TPA: VOC family protein [Sphingobium sp.]|uniref:VOC family protein n=1 Tax=Sphingobium sp. TaxID=1912891 RepID=UPI002ED1BCED